MSSFTCIVCSHSPVVEFPDLKCLDSTAVTSADCCQCCGAWRTSTSLLSCHLHESEFHRIRHRCGGRRHCSRTERPHIKHCDTGPRKQRWAHVAQHFPPRLNRALGCLKDPLFLTLPLGLSGHAHNCPRRAREKIMIWDLTEGFKTNWGSTHKPREPWVKAGDEKVAWAEKLKYVAICMSLNGSSAPSVQHRMKQAQETYRK